MSSEMAPQAIRTFLYVSIVSREGGGERDASGFGALLPLAGLTGVLGLVCS
jgi:hypothetical protein